MRLKLQPSLSLQAFNPGNADNEKFQGTFTANWQLGSTLIESSISYPEYEFDAQLAPGEQLDLSALSNGLLKGFPVPNIDITTLSVNGNVFLKNYNFLLKAESNYSLQLLGGDSIEIEQVQLGVNHNSGVNSYQMQGQFQLDNIPISVSADYDGKNWQFSGQSFPTTPIDFKSLFSALPGNNDATALITKVKSFFPDFDIDNIQFNYNGAD